MSQPKWPTWMKPGRFVPAALSYLDFPFARDAFCLAKSRAQKVEIDGVHLRYTPWAKGQVEKDQYFLLGFTHMDRRTRDVLEGLRRAGHVLKTADFTCGRPMWVRVRKGYTFFRVEGEFDTDYADRSPISRRRILRSCMGLDVEALDRTTDDAWSVFHAWRPWAIERRYWVLDQGFRGWLMRFEGSYDVPTLPFLYLIRRGAEPVGIFAGEYDPVTDEAQIAVAIHTPDVAGTAIWTLGMRAMLFDFKPEAVHCGQRSERLKVFLGFQPHSGWMPVLTEKGLFMPRDLEAQRHA